MPRLRFTIPDGGTYEFELAGERATIGRAEGNDFVLPDGSVSSRHGEIHSEGDSIEIVDLGSTNGTHVAGQRVERAKIGPGESFRLGSVEGILVGEAPSAAQVPAVDAAPPPEPAEDPIEKSAPEPSWSGAPAAGHAVVTGLGSTPCPVRQRSGFGSKGKAKDGAATLLTALGIGCLLVCAGAAFLISKMGA